MRRPRRPKGERSRERILEAALEVATVRGYDGTSMAEISRRCGLPTSSIYWHFQDKDDLMAQVIETSFREWTASWETEPDLDLFEQFPVVVQRVLGTLRDFPEFLRLGLPLALQQRSDDPAARRMYLQSRSAALASIREIGERYFPEIPEDARESVVSYCLSAVDGLFIASELDENVDLERQLALHSKALSLLISDALESVPGDGDGGGGAAGAAPMGVELAAPSEAELSEIAAALHDARVDAAEIEPPTESLPGLTPELAYSVQARNRERDLASGHRLVGHKIGLTSEAMQLQLGVAEPDCGYLTDRMVLAAGARTPRGSYVAPRVEPEIAFRLARDLDASEGRVSAADVLAATDAVAVALEIVDSRIADWRITLADTVADNASSAAVALGPWVPLAGVGALADLHGELKVDGELAGSGDGSAVLGDPAEAVAWLANSYGAPGSS